MFERLGDRAGMVLVLRECDKAGTESTTTELGSEVMHTGAPIIARGLSFPRLKGSLSGEEWVEDYVDRLEKECQ